MNHNLIQISRLCNDLHDDERIIFCKRDYILEEYERIKSKHNKIILIIGNSDYTFDDELLSKCPNNVEHIFSTNTTCLSEKVTPIPIGVENEVQAKRELHGFINVDIFEKKPFLLGKIKPKISALQNKIYTNFSVGTNIELRQPLFDFCVQNEIFNTEIGLSYESYVNQVGSHIATLSPRGNGIECIRTYEVLYLKSIPIVFGNHKDYQAIYEKIYKNLPIVYCNYFEQLKDLSTIEKNIKKVRNNSIELLDYYYWLNLITKKANKI